MSDHIRLLVCRDCRTIEELPDYEGPADHDVILDHMVEQHRFPNAEMHIGNLMRVEKRVWENPSAQAEITKQIASQTTGLDTEFYATKKTFEEDALKCYTAHHRPDADCGDYRNDKKRIGNPTKVGWELGMKVWLCDFCPVQSWVNTQERHQTGAYKEN